jgi:tetratricopeptide (TPR) repeat protein
VESLDSESLDPALQRALIAYRQARVAHEPREALASIQRGIAEAERVLRRSPNHARALELRGTMRYWHWHLRITPDPVEQARLLQSAREDLEAAVQADPTLASAHSTLSHFYYNVDDITAAVLAARRAYEEDAYLDVAHEVLWRLTLGSYDLEQLPQAQRWCDEGANRFPRDYRFAHCRLLLMTTPHLAADVPQAWQLLARQDSLLPPERKQYEQARGRMLVAGVIARSGQPDSARAVLRTARALVTPAIDPGSELLLVEAHVNVLMGNQDQAIDLLKRYAAVSPHYSFDHSWWWRPLQRNPRFREVTARQ